MEQQTQLRQALQMLRQLEWSGLELELMPGKEEIYHSVPCCPVCLEKMRGDDHAPDCELAAILDGNQLHATDRLNIEKEEIEMSLKIEDVSEIPDFSQRGKWHELFERAENMKVDQVIRVQLNNRKECTSAQASLQAGHSDKSHRNSTSLRKLGYRFLTRTQPVNGSKDGQWYLYIKRIA